MIKWSKLPWGKIYHWSVVLVTLSNYGNKNLQIHRFQIIVSKIYINIFKRNLRQKIKWTCIEICFLKQLRPQERAHLNVFFLNILKTFKKKFQNLGIFISFIHRVKFWTQNSNVWTGASQLRRLGGSIHNFLYADFTSSFITNYKNRKCIHE